VLLVLVLSAMRAGSWTLGWVLARLVPWNGRSISIASNAGAFVLFVTCLLLTLFPGEPLDMAAILFGFIVFAACSIGDFYWRPWKPRA
jgi:hypothetical protein